MLRVAEYKPKLFRSFEGKFVDGALVLTPSGEQQDGDLFKRWRSRAVPLELVGVVSESGIMPSVTAASTVACITGAAKAVQQRISAASIDCLADSDIESLFSQTLKLNGIAHTRCTSEDMPNILCAGRRLGVDVQVYKDPKINVVGTVRERMGTVSKYVENTMTIIIIAFPIGVDVSKSS